MQIRRPSRRRWRSGFRLVTVALALLTSGEAPAADSAASSSCPLERDGPTAAAQGTAIWTSPRDAEAGRPFRVLAVANDKQLGELMVFDPAERIVTGAVVARGGPPWSLETTVGSAAPGVYRIEVRRDGTTISCRRLAVGDGERHADSPARESDRAWDRGTEAFYSAWIAHLFDAPPDDDLSFRPLHEALRDPDRNFLHDHLDLGEDDASPQALIAEPDCADLPYFLRAYFAWKLGLPFGFRRCDRGSAAGPPRCGAFLGGAAASRTSLASFKALAQQVMGGVHSGNARAALADDATDFYPVALERDVIRPGVLYADPYGHTLLVVGWVPQTSSRGGMLLAVDAQPDASVGRKRFWEGTFLFADPAVSGAGFKAFRPIVRDGRGVGGPVRPLSNAALADHDAALPISQEQARLSPGEFYARVGRLINPDGLDPAQAYRETLDALVEQLEVRLQSVDNGEQYMRTHRDAVVPMPVGASIFETTGPWEDYATPSRDMRLIVAMKVLSSLPDRIVAHPDLYVLGGRKPADAAAEVKDLHAQQTPERAITYTRSDGTPWKLTVADVLARKSAFEVAYNPNDCAEVRWGAAEGTAEYATLRASRTRLAARTHGRVSTVVPRSAAPAALGNLGVSARERGARRTSESLRR